MALSAFPVLEGDVVDMSTVICNIDEETEDAHDQLLLDAVRIGDLHAIHTLVNSLHGQSSMRAKLLALQRGDADLLRGLLEMDNAIDRSLIEAACISKDQACMLALLDCGLPINQPLNPDQYVLWTAVNDITFARFLVSAGADVNCRSRYDVSALSAAIVYGSIDVVRFLISEKTELTYGDLLHCAAARENQVEGAELVEELAQKGADVNAYSFDNAVEAPFRKRRTPLHVAVQQDNTAVARALIKYGADPSRMCCQAGELVRPTALEEAIVKKNEVMIQLLTFDSGTGLQP